MVVLDMSTRAARFWPWHRVGALQEPALRSLDAIHVAAAASVSPIDAFLSYDERQAAVARLAGLRIVAPAR